MEILNSGSFVCLDNREKIDQLIYTARELATEVGRTEGFQNSGQTNHQLGLEMWVGAEYVCRAHEEANIRNLFLSKFLERLREIEKEATFQARPVQMPAVFSAPIRQPQPATVSVPLREPQTVAEQPPQSEQDEYLGVVPVDDQTVNKRPSDTDEWKPEYDADIEAIVDRLENEDYGADADRSFEQIGTESQHSEVVTVEASADEKETNSSVTLEQSASSVFPAEEDKPDTAESVESESIGPIVLAEKEPYNFDSCTVTAVVQLLPEVEGVRKCVVSVRTHDFTPGISIVDVTAADVLHQISATLGLAFEKYRNELPARAADKIKKEKPAAKKQSNVGSKAKATTVESKAATKSEMPTTAPAQTAENSQGQRGLFTS